MKIKVGGISLKYRKVTISEFSHGGTSTKHEIVYRIYDEIPSRKSKILTVQKYTGNDWLPER